MPDDTPRFIDTATSRTDGFYRPNCMRAYTCLGAAHRLNRDFGKRFGDWAYAFEELVAEHGAAFLCAELGITNAPRADHAQYLANWLSILKADKRAVFHAAARRSKPCSS